MARTASTKEKAQTRNQKLNEEFKKSHPFTYVNIKLSDTEKSEILESPLTVESIGGWIAEMSMGKAYKVGVSYDFESKCFVVSFTAVFWGRDDYNRCVTSRHSDIGVAFAIAAYKYDQYCYELIPSPEEKPSAGAVFD